MQKIQIEKTIKKFDEFSKDEQEEIINNYRDINVDFDDWNDYVLYKSVEQIKEKTIFDLDTTDLIWSVGDRNSHFGVYSKKVIGQLIEKYNEQGVYDIETPEKIGSFLNHLGGGMCSKNATEQGKTIVYFENDDLKQNKDISEQINTQIDILIDILKESHTDNENAYNYAISDESIKETIIANEYDFDVDNMRIF